MNITTHHEIKDIGTRGDAQLVIHVSVDGALHSFVHLSGPKPDVEAYARGEIDIVEVRRRWFPAFSS